MASYTKSVTPSEREVLQESGVQTQETPEEKLLRAIFGSADGREVTAPLMKEITPTPELITPVSVPSSGVGNSAVVTLAQMWITRHLPAAEIEDISTLASAVIGDKRKATQWLSEPNNATDNRAPIDLIGERDGYERVKSLLMRVEYGVLD
jgi:hypothetical protein